MLLSAGCTISLSSPGFVTLAFLSGAGLAMMVASSSLQVDLYCSGLPALTSLLKGARLTARLTDFVMCSAQSLCFLLFPILKTWCVAADCLTQLTTYNLLTNAETVVHRMSAYPWLNRRRLLFGVRSWQNLHFGGEHCKVNSGHRCSDRGLTSTNLTSASASCQHLQQDQNWSAKWIRCCKIEVQTICDPNKLLHFG